MPDPTRHPTEAPDPSHSYERSHPEREPGMGRLENDADGATPTDNPDAIDTAVHNRQPSRQLNAQDVVSGRAAEKPGDQPVHSMLDEEPLDAGPTDIVDPRKKRHPRTEGKGGTP